MKVKSKVTALLITSLVLDGLLVLLFLGASALPFIPGFTDYFISGAKTGFFSIPFAPLIMVILSFIVKLIFTFVILAHIEEERAPVFPEVFSTIILSGIGMLFMWLGNLVSTQVLLRFTGAEGYAVFGYINSFVQASYFVHIISNSIFIFACGISYMYKKMDLINR